MKPPLRWIPLCKDFTNEFLHSKSKDPSGPTFQELTSGPESVLQEAQRVLGRCLPPSEQGPTETGLVVGYVQSGKTMSFETVIALARDNGYGLVIVLAGTKNNLRDQSEDRLRNDLGIDEGGDHWYHLSNPKGGARAEIETKLNAWRKRPEKKSLLITVLKHGGHLEKLAKVLSSVNLQGVPALIIDDESDQASLNTRAARIRAGRAAIAEMSTTYEKLLKLRAALPHHSYLQYTATPQANLLLAQTDVLNPDFGEVVTPGDSYTGGREFFLQKRNLVVNIPPKDVPGPNNQVKGPPKSLLSSLRYFLLVAAHHSLTREKGRRPKDRNRSMMVHPALATAAHKTYRGWVDNALKSIRPLVEVLYAKKPQSVEKLFKAEYDSLAATYPSLRPLKELLGELAEEVFDDLRVVEINGTPDAEKKVNWKATKYWILIGGAKLDRGYTVEGLCITYMPRPLGTSPAADTLQQRARFFGYKSRYLGLCRVFLEPSVAAAFTEYVEHEEFVRDALVANRGKPLVAWRRDFILTALLKPTRPNVIGLGVRRIPANGWMVPSALQRGEIAREENRKLLHDVMTDWQKQYGHAVDASALVPQVDKSQHDLIESVPLKAVLEDFLLKVQMRDPRDSEEHSAMLIALAAVLASHPDALVDVVLMNRLKTGYRTRKAGKGVAVGNKNAPINQYFSQSAGTKNDRDYRSTGTITLQLRKFDLGTNQRDSASADIKDVVWFALHIPKPLRKELLIEER